MDLKALVLGTLKSKSIWLGVLTIATANIEPAKAWIVAHFSGQVAVTITGLLTIVVRYLTDQSVSEKGSGLDKGA